MAKRHSTSNISKERLRQLGNKLVLRHRNFYVYVVFGFLAALINILTFWLFHNLWKIPWFYANILAFIISNLASFVFNKHGVFIENVDESHSVIYQLALFFLYRVLSLIPDNIIMFLGMSCLHWNTFVVKAIDQIVVGIFNYLTTKSIFLKSSSKLAKLLKRRIKDKKKS
ncbi:GtrA family protein [uncultured Lactobacillus sp.]|uniref:GtrA family protein n=1 Tax=uncultured Lactobacillus sp. TaxID=153152 RepID=UPI00261957D7|nr:GtrA family protein [uncultured Lactobacillus sp.]